MHRRKAAAPHPGDQFLKGGYDFEKTDRDCSGSWISCADAPTTKENTVGAESYDALQYDGVSNVLPTSQTAPNFTVHIVGASYIYRF